MQRVFPSSTDLSVAYIRFESSQGKPTLARKLAKSLLKTQSTNLRLWNEYALMEHRASHVAEARKVYNMALAADLPAAARVHAPLLFRCYAETEFYRPYAHINYLVSCCSNKVSMMNMNIN